MLQDKKPSGGGDFDTAMRQLRGRLVAAGLFRGSLLYFGRKVAELHLLLAASAWLLWTGSPWASAMLLGLFFQQAGWAAHCFLHQAVFSDYRLNHLVGDRYLGNLFQGFSAEWWCEKHFRHHALPNGWLEREDGEVVAFDSDVDTSPLLLWVPHLAAGVPDAARRWLLPHQHVYALVLLCFSKLAWNIKAMEVSIAAGKRLDVALMAAHYVGFLFAGAALSGSWVAGAAWYLRGMCVGGFLLAFVFIQSHSATTELRGFTRGFYTSQMLTTRNISTDPFTTWFTGGLNYQIEHHLFPRLPRHNYGRVAPEVRAVCAAHGIKYEELGLLECSAMLLRHLYDMGRPPKSI